MTATDPRAWLDAVDARTNAATGGPWEAEYSGEQGNCVLPPDARSTREAVAVTRLYYQVADAEFIAHARTDLPAATTALRAVLDLADMWDSRADHDLEALKAFPVEVQDALYGQAWDMKHKATYIRAAITTALTEDV